MFEEKCKIMSLTNNDIETYVIQISKIQILFYSVTME